MPNNPKPNLRKRGEEICRAFFINVELKKGVFFVSGMEFSPQTILQH